MKPTPPAAADTATTSPGFGATAWTLASGGHRCDVHRTGDLPRQRLGLADDVVSRDGDETGVAGPLVGPSEHRVADGEVGNADADADTAGHRSGSSTCLTSSTSGSPNVSNRMARMAVLLSRGAR
jgi:hypothetical protein